MQKVEFSEVNERVETGVSSAHNVTKGCSISTKVTVADLAKQPLRALKMLMDGLATDGESSLWLRSLLGPPLMMHLFPFDFVYLDEDLRIMEAVELFPRTPFPRFQPAVASALILPLRTLALTGSQRGDQIVICAPQELKDRLAEIAVRHDVAPSPVSAIPQSGETFEAPLAADCRPVSRPLGLDKPAYDARVPVRTSTVSSGTGFTVSLATTWQVTRTTTATAVLPDPEEETLESSTVLAGEDWLQEPELAPEPSSAIAQIDDPAPASSLEGRESLTEHHQAISGPDPAANRLLKAVALAEAAEAVEPAPVASELPGDETDSRIARSREAWEKTQVKTPHGPAPSEIKPKKKTREPKKDPLGTRVIRWLNLQDPLPERRKIIRLRLEGLEAYDVNGDQARRYEIRDVCPTGFCLRAEDEWQPGQLVSLVIARKGSTEKDHEHRVRVQARVVRSEEDGVGLEFVFPKGTEFQPWQRAKTKRPDETEAAFIVRELRFSQAVGFLRRLCPGAAEQARHAFHERLSNKRVASAVDIVLLAEDALASTGQADLALAHSETVMRIIEGGSWIEDGWIRKLWSGLLVSSCTADGKDTSNQPVIDLLAKLTPLHLRILSFVCGRAAEAISSGRPAKEFHLDCTAEELMGASDSHSFARIQQTIGHLSTYGLLAEKARPSYVTLADKSKTWIAPTALGLKMWTRCNGQRA